MLMTHTTEAISELDANSDVAVSQSLSTALKDENEISDVDHWQNENLGPLSSEKNEEKLVTVVKKVCEMFIAAAIK